MWCIHPSIRYGLVYNSPDQNIRPTIDIVLEAIEWGEDRNISVMIYDYNMIKFTNEKDMIFFMLGHA